MYIRIAKDVIAIVGLINNTFFASVSHAKEKNSYSLIWPLVKEAVYINHYVSVFSGPLRRNFPLMRERESKLLLLCGGADIEE